jgi:5'(3')-deoxyribonucleotidase
MIVLLDVDGVVADFTGAIKKIIKEMSGLDYEITSWLKLDQIPCSKVDRANIAFQIGLAARGLEVLPGAQEGVKALKAAGHDVHFVTSRWNSLPWVYDRCQWMAKHGFVTDPHREITFTAAKWRVHGHVLVDDKPRNVEEWQRAWPFGHGLIWDQPWNKSAEGVRITDWENLLSFTKWTGNSK